MLPSNTRSRARSTATVLAAVLLLLLLAACGGKDGNEDKAVAEYEGGTVTEAEFNGFLGAHKFFNYNEMYLFFESMPDFKRSMLNQYIAIELLTADLDEQTKEASAKRAREEMKGLDESLKEDKTLRENLDAFLKEHNMKKDDLEKYIFDQFNLQAVFESKFTEEDLRSKYEEEIALDKHAYITTATVRHILVSTTDEEGKEIRTMDEALARAKEVQVKLKNGGDWTTLAKEYSDDPGSKDNGGQYVNAEIDRWVPEFRQAALDQPIGEIGEPFETAYGYHVMVVEERASNAYDDVKGLVKNQLVNEFFVDYIENEVPKLTTRVNLPEAEQPAEGEEAEAPDDNGDGAENSAENDAENGEQ